MGETLDKTQSLSTSFAQRLLQGRRIYRFISICELCLQLENFMPYKWLFYAVPTANEKGMYAKFSAKDDSERASKYC